MVYLAEKPCQLPDWTKYSSYYSATAGIRNYDFPHILITSKKSHALTNDTVEAI